MLDRNARTLLALAIIAAISSLTSCGGSNNQQVSSTAIPGSEAPGEYSARVARDLSEDEMRRYVATMADFRAAGVETKDLKGKTTDLSSMLAGVESHGKVMDALKHHEFTTSQFEEVHYNVMMAWAALELEGKKAEIEASRAEQAGALEAMKGKMSEEQLKTIESSMEMADAQLQEIQDAPAQNVKLVRAHRQELLAALGPSR